MLDWSFPGPFLNCLLIPSHTGSWALRSKRGGRWLPPDPAGPALPPASHSLMALSPKVGIQLAAACPSSLLSTNSSSDEPRPHLHVQPPRKTAGSPRAEQLHTMPSPGPHRENMCTNPRGPLLLNLEHADFTKSKILSTVGIAGTGWPLAAILGKRGLSAPAPSLTGQRSSGASTEHRWRQVTGAAILPTGDLPSRPELPWVGPWAQSPHVRAGPILLPH